MGVELLIEGVLASLGFGLCYSNAPFYPRTSSFQGLRGQRRMFFFLRNWAPVSGVARATPNTFLCEIWRHIRGCAGNAEYFSAKSSSLIRGCAGNGESFSAKRVPLSGVARATPNAFFCDIGPLIRGCAGNGEYFSAKSTLLAGDTLNKEASLNFLISLKEASLKFKVASLNLNLRVFHLKSNRRKPP